MFLINELYQINAFALKYSVCQFKSTLFNLLIHTFLLVKFNKKKYQILINFNSYRDSSMTSMRRGEYIAVAPTSDSMSRMYTRDSVNVP